MVGFKTSSGPSIVRQGRAKYEGPREFNEILK